MKTLSLLLSRPPECPSSRWEHLVAVIAKSALNGSTLRVCNTGFSARSIVMLAVDAEPIIFWHVALHQDTSEDETKKLFALAQEDHDLIKLSCTDPQQAVMIKLEQALSNLFKK